VLVRELPEGTERAWCVDGVWFCRVEHQLMRADTGEILTGSGRKWLTAVGGRGLAILASAPDQSGQGESLRVFRAEGVQEHLFAWPDGGTTAGAVCDDGSAWTLLGRRIVPLAELGAGAPPEDLLQSVVEIALRDNCDEERLRPLLERITRFPASSLRGLASVLTQGNDPLAPLRSVAGRTVDLRRELELLAEGSPRDVPAGLPVSADEMEGALGSLRSAEQELIRLVALHADPVWEVAARLREGSQLCGDWWLRRLSTVAWISTDALLFSARACRYGEARSFDGLFVLRGNRGVELLLELETPIEGMQIVEGHNGSLFAFSPVRGLGRVELDPPGFAWIDQGVDIRAMDTLHGCDSMGRLLLARRISASDELPGVVGQYLSPRRRRGGGAGEMEEQWLYRQDGSARESRVTAQHEGVFTACLDSRGRPWAVSGASLFDPDRLQTFLDEDSGGDTVQLSGACVLAVLEGGEWVPRLRLSSPMVSLVPGGNGALFAFPSGPFRIGVWLLDESGEPPLEGATLHELAQSHPARTLAAAPRALAWLPGQAFGILAVEDLVWVIAPHAPTIDVLESTLHSAPVRQGARGRLEPVLEVYRDGVSQNVSRRIELLVGDSRDPIMAGPLRTATGPGVLVRPLPGAWIGTVVAIQSEGGIALETVSAPPVLRNLARGLIPCPDPPLWPLDNGVLAALQGLEEAVIVDGPDRVTLLPGAGGLVGVLGDGRVLTSREVTFGEWFQVGTLDGEWQDIPVEPGHNLPVVAPLGLDRVLCLTTAAALVFEADNAGGWRESAVYPLPLSVAPARLVGTVDDRVYLYGRAGRRAEGVLLELSVGGQAL
jgi:hypothetical protein